MTPWQISTTADLLPQQDGGGSLIGGTLAYQAGGCGFKSHLPSVESFSPLFSSVSFSSAFGGNELLLNILEFWKKPQKPIHTHEVISFSDQTTV